MAWEVGTKAQAAANKAARVMAPAARKFTVLPEIME
jgi:hypothetical protein